MLIDSSMKCVDSFQETPMDSPKGLRSMYSCVDKLLRKL